MQTLVCVSPGVFEYKTTAEPERQESHALIRIKRIGICGTDFHAYDGTQPYFTYPRILGHELSGEIVDIADNPDFRKAQRVTFLPYFSCGKCIACRMNKPNCCAQIQVFGVHIDGGMCEYVSIPLQYLVDSQHLSYDELALVEPLSIGAHGIARASVKEDEYVLVIGAGPIGLGTMEFARIAGAKVIVMDVNQKRLQFCEDRLKVHATVDASRDDVVKRLKEITNGDMPTVVIDATGNIRAINKGIDYLAHGGRYVLIGLQKENFAFSHPEFHKRESTLMSSRNATKNDFEKVISSIKNDAIKPENYITHRVNFDDLAGMFPSLMKPETGVIKAMISIG